MQQLSLNENKARSGNVSYSGRSRMGTFQTGTKGYEQTLSSRLGEGTGEARHNASDGCPGEITLKLKGMSFYSSSTGVSRRCGSKQLKRLIRSTAQGSGGVYVTSAFQRYGNKCCVCGRGANDGMVMHVDHIKPRSLYPHLALDIANLQIMCNECNVSKGNRDEVEWQ